jgi:hypothetical protein
MRKVLEIMVLSSYLFLLAFVYVARNFLFGPKTAAIVGSIPVPVNVKQFAPEMRCSMEKSFA